MNKEFSGLQEAAFLLAIFSVASQILALFRDRILAGTFGAGQELDIYYAAFKIPDMIFVFIASFLSITVLVPMIVDKVLAGGREKDLHHFLDSAVTMFLLAILPVTAVAYFLLPKLATFVAPGFDFDSTQQLVRLSRVLLLSPLLLGLSSLLGSITQTFRRFFVYALGPILYNFGIIFGILFFYPKFGLSGLAHGVILGAFLHLIVQMPFIFKKRLMPRVIFNPDWILIKNILTLSIPRSIALGSTQLAILVLVAMASFFQSGSIAVFNLSFGLQSIPLAVIGVSYSVASLPNLSRLFSRHNLKEFVFYVEDAFRHIIFWSLPAIAMFIVLRAQIVRVVLGSGVFDWNSTRLVAASLAIFSISSLAQSSVHLFNMAYYSAGQTIKPVIMRIVGAVVIVAGFFLFDWLFGRFDFLESFIGYLFRVADLKDISVLILPISFTIGFIVNFVLIILMFIKDFGRLSKDLLNTFWQSLVASVLSGVVTYWCLWIFAVAVEVDTFVEIFLQGLVSGLVGLFGGATYLWLVDNKELGEFLLVLRSRFWKSEAIVPEQIDVV